MKLQSALPKADDEWSSLSQVRYLFPFSSRSRLFYPAQLPHVGGRIRAAAKSVYLATQGTLPVQPQVVCATVSPSIRWPQGFDDGSARKVLPRSQIRLAEHLFS